MFRDLGFRMCVCVCLCIMLNSKILTLKGTSFSSKWLSVDCSPALDLDSFNTHGCLDFCCVWRDAVIIEVCFESAGNQ